MDVYKRRTILFVTTIICWQNAKNILKLRLWVIYVLYTECTVQYYSCVHVHKMKSFNLKVCSKLCQIQNKKLAKLQNTSPNQHAIRRIGFFKSTLHYCPHLV